MGGGAKQGKGKGRNGNKNAGTVRVACNVPVSAYGKIIGKGGETVKSLQSEFNVRIWIPREGDSTTAAVTVEGANEELVEECKLRIEEMVLEVSQTGKSAGKGRGKQPYRRPGMPFPGECKLCQSQITGLSQCFTHIGSKKHIEALVREMPDLVDVVWPCKDPKEVAVILESSREVHLELGFDVDALIREAETFKERCDLVGPRAYELIPEDTEWLQVEQRWYSEWDTSPDQALHRPMTSAPPLDVMLARCTLVNVSSLPMVRLPPRLPVPLPKMRGKSLRKKAWPQEPTTRLGLAVLLKSGHPVGEVDVICGTSLMHALSGNGKYTKEDYFFEKYKDAWICLSVPKRKTEEKHDTGHAIEHLLTNSGISALQRSASSLVRIAGRRVLITSELDARDSDNNVLELKSSSKGKSWHGALDRKVALQVACNGSDSVLFCSVNSDQTQMEQVTYVTRSELLAHNEKSYIQYGQRIRYLLSSILEDLAAEKWAGKVVHMTFNDNVEPVLQDAPGDVSVVPTGLPS